MNALTDSGLRLIINKCIFKKREIRFNEVDEQIKKKRQRPSESFLRGGSQDAAGGGVHESRARGFMLGWFLLKTSRLGSSEVAIIQSC